MKDKRHLFTRKKVIDLFDLIIVPFLRTAILNDDLHTYIVFIIIDHAYKHGHSVP